MYVLLSNLYKWYRMGYRTTEQFAEDIKYGSKAERVIIEWYVEYYRNKYGDNLIVLDNGTYLILGLKIKVYLQKTLPFNKGIK